MRVVIKIHWATDTWHRTLYITMAHSKCYKITFGEAIFYEHPYCTMTDLIIMPIKFHDRLKKYSPLRVSSLSLSFSLSFFLYIHIYTHTYTISLSSLSRENAGALTSGCKKRRRERSRCAIMHKQTVRRSSAKYPHRLATDTWSRYSGGLKLRHRRRNSVSVAPGIDERMKKILSPSLSPPLPPSLFFYTHRRRKSDLHLATTGTDLRGCRSWKLVKPNEIHALIRQMIKPWFTAALALRCCARGLHEGRNRNFSTCMLLHQSRYQRESSIDRPSHERLDTYLLVNQLL